MSQIKNYYKTLGVEKYASFADIKKRYRELAKKHHPDVNNGSEKAENNFKIISVAYKFLSDKKKAQRIRPDLSTEISTASANSGRNHLDRCAG